MRLARRLTALCSPFRSPSRGVPRLRVVRIYRVVTTRDHALTRPSGHATTEILRTELIGKHGESCAFHVRYFEVGPGGYSTLEKHQHEHVVIPIRGRGVVRSPPLRLRPARVHHRYTIYTHSAWSGGATPAGARSRVTTLRRERCRRRRRGRPGRTELQSVCCRSCGGWQGNMRAGYVGGRVPPTVAGSGSVWMPLSRLSLSPSSREKVQTSAKTTQQSVLSGFGDDCSRIGSCAVPCSLGCPAYQRG